MLMQSAGGEIHLLPALPDTWKSGSVSGLRAIGGFEILSIDWKDGMLVKAVIKSTLGGNLRLRTPNGIKLSNGSALKTAAGENPNSFYQVEETPAPIISAKASFAAPALKETMLYDLPTVAGKTYTLIAK